ncbi:hypothetical protein QTI33_03675 [Variovorax sp. J22P271]|uniref:hypothetical protein n=1 Tax=Variovorax davisae TaxID=3053515 RepID=UPI002574F2D5|nr:hypothetical protein [Variovorax sp. J22P271]MDM0031234.1 hypothetical protein [Variovorax sp. J22P271]
MFNPSPNGLTTVLALRSHRIVALASLASLALVPCKRKHVATARADSASPLRRRLAIENGEAATAP